MASAVLVVASGCVGAGGDDLGIRLGPIRVDQFGYRPGDPKVAVISDPQVGFDADRSFQPGDVYEVRRVDDDRVVFTGRPEPWQDGAVHDQSGDRGWWFDFGAVTEPGRYRIVDVDHNVASGAFEVTETVYDDVLDTALRAFWFNRANVSHPAALAGPWADEAAYVGPGQDTEARSVDAPDDASTERDLSGGWFDAGDPNKYVTFAAEPVHLLLTAYARHPHLFGDDVGIPESGNGIADLVDEVQFEIEWLERMQLDDGGVLLKVGQLEYGDPGTPSEVGLPRFYVEACSSSTIAAAAMFAHAAIVFGTVPDLAGNAERLEARAVAAWEWYQANPVRDDCDDRRVRAGDADVSVADQADAAVVAAVYLHTLTSEERYDTVVREGFADTAPFTGGGFGAYRPEQADALRHYAARPGADRTVVAAINGRIDAVAGSPLHGFDPAASLYRALLPDEQYHWGSNRVMANVGTANFLDGDAEGAVRGLAHLHYFHGINPLGLVQLSNMDEHGAESSAQHLFHHWFGPGTEFDVDRGSAVGVPPGFVVGGANRAYSGTAAPPAGQPPMKSYRDWSGGDGEPVWEITEPAIYYQAAYVRLLSEVLATPSP